MAVNIQGKFTVTQGISKTKIEGNSLSSKLYFSEDSDLYSTIYATVTANGEVDGEAISAAPDVPKVKLSGYLFREDDEVSVVLTDGWTTFGIAKRE